MSIPASEELQRALAGYPDVVAAQNVSNLSELDDWYRTRLPGLIHAREPAHVTLDEMVRLTQWKMARGVWRGRNLALVKSNAEADVVQVSTDAFGEMPHATRPIAALAKLRGVGPATASAAVAAARPDRYPFFDELVAAQLPGLGPVKWNLSYYGRYSEALREAAMELGGEWTPVRLEQALWAHVGGKAGRSS